MPEESFRFTWPIAKHGYVFDTLGPTHTHVNTASIVLRAATPAAPPPNSAVKEFLDSFTTTNETHAVSLQQATTSLEQYCENDPLERQACELTSQRSLAEILANAWWQIHRRPIQAERMSFPLHEHTGLFKTFGSIAPTADGILAFAQEYGNLMECCPILVWHEEVLAVRRALRIWGLLETQETEQLRRHFRWQSFSPERIRELSQPSGLFVADDPMPDYAPNPYRLSEMLWRAGTGTTSYLVIDSHPDLLPDRRPPSPDHRVVELLPVGCFTPDEWRRQFEDLNVLAVARAYLRKVFDDRFEKFVHSRLVWKGNKKLTRVFVPRHLIGAIWLQFEQAIAGEKKYTACPACGKWFELSAVRADTEYCSGRCRTRASRERQTRARDMFDGGISIAEISHQLDTKEETIKAWVLKKKRKEK